MFWFFLAVFVKMVDLWSWLSRNYVLTFVRTIIIVLVDTKQEANHGPNQSTAW